jgi:hypothetical protein
MRPTEAIQLDNFFPGVQDVVIRNGSVNWATGAPATLHSFLPYNGPVTNKLFAATTSGIYDVTNSGAIGASVFACTGGFFKTTMMATAGGNFLFGVNGSDAAILYDGTTWSNPSITGADTTQWNYVATHKHRIWAIQKNSTNLYYLGIDSIAGPATLFPVGALFRKGGHIVAIGTWTLDFGFGVDDRFVIATSNGEIAVYQGIDPASSSTWSLIGIFDVPLPIGDKPFLAYGGDLLYLSTIGIIPLSKLAQSTIIDRSSSISFNIDGAFITAATSYSSVIGWDMIIHKAGNLLIVNVPVQQDVLSYQYVMNTTTKAWCRFTGWNASSWIEFNGNLYFTAGTKTVQAWVGSNDAGAPIVANCAQAYNYFGMHSQKRIEMIRPNFGFTGSAQIMMAFDNDFNTFNGQTQFSYTPVGTGAIWDTGLWDSGKWDAGVSLFEPQWTTVPNNPGYMHSLRLQIVASSGNFTWTSSDLVIKAAGIL